MSTSTTNLCLTKPAAGENYSRAVFNNNMDLIDTAYLRSLRAGQVQTFTAVTWGSALAAGAIPGKDFRELNESFVGTTDASGYCGINLPYTLLVGI